MYFSTDKSCDVFAYAPGEYPYEFAPDVDHDRQFEKTILDPMNPAPPVTITSEVKK